MGSFFQTWLKKLATSDIVRVQRNIGRLQQLKSKVHELGYFGVATQSGGFQVLSSLLEESIVQGRPIVHDKLKSALLGENNQKVVLDAPLRFQQLMKEAEELIEKEIAKESRELRKLTNG